MAFSSRFRQRLFFSEGKTLGGTSSNAGRFQTYVQPIFAIVAFDYLADILTPLWRSPWTGGNACLAADAKVVVNKDDTIAGTLLHGAGGAGGNTPGVFTVKAEHEDEGGSRQTPDQFRPDILYLTQTRASRQVRLGFALDLAGMAANAFAGILGKMVPAHENSPLGKSSTRHGMSPHGTCTP